MDIDYQAVEVTKLSLLLKALEGETKESVARMLFHKERALPDLADNIKCGNSLIGSDFYVGKQRDLFDEKEALRINAFDWEGKHGFPNIFSGENPGFDAVIGNPPYVNAWEFFANSPAARDYINSSVVYKTADRHWDLYVVFLERALQLSRSGARISFIIPFSYAIQKYARKSRQHVLTSATLDSVADLRTVRMFGRVPVITIIPVLLNRQAEAQSTVEVFRPGAAATKYHAGTIEPSHEIQQSRFLGLHEEMLRLDLTEAGFQLCRRIEERSDNVGKLCWVNYGAQMSSKEKGKFGKDFVLRDKRESSTCRKTVSGRDLYRYNVHWSGKYVEWDLADEMYGPRVPEFFELPKLMIRDITGTHRLELTRDSSGLYCDHTILCAQRGCDAKSWREIDDNTIRRSMRYSDILLLGLLASRLVSAYFYLKLTGEGVRTGGGFHTYPETIRQLPVFRLDDRCAPPVLKEIETHSCQMLDLNARLSKVKTDHERTVISRQIEATDREIDRLVYALYGLTEEEIRLVEEATKQ